MIHEIDTKTLIKTDIEAITDRVSDVKESFDEYRKKSDIVITTHDTILHTHDKVLKVIYDKAGESEILLCELTKRYNKLSTFCWVLLAMFLGVTFALFYHMINS